MKMCDRTNAGRAVDASQAIETHSGLTGIIRETDDIQLSDLLCNLMHWCAENDVNWAGCIDRAETHYDTEWREENDG
jgi:hypothetical protein